MFQSKRVLKGWDVNDELASFGEQVSCSFWMLMFSPLAQDSQSPNVFCLHDSTHTGGQMQGVTPVPQLPFLSFYGMFGPFGAGHCLKLDTLCIYACMVHTAKYIMIHTCKSLRKDSILSHVDGWIVQYILLAAQTDKTLMSQHWGFKFVLGGSNNKKYF